MPDQNLAKFQALIGFGEGLRIALIIAAALVAAGQSNPEIAKIILLLTIPSALILAVGIYLSELAEADALSHKVLPHETEPSFYLNIGLDEETSRLAVADARQELEEWEAQMGNEKPATNRSIPFLHSFLAFTAYVCGAMLIGCFFYFLSDVFLAFWVAVISGILLLTAVSLFKVKFNGIPLKVELISTVAITIIALCIVFLVSSLVTFSS